MSRRTALLSACLVATPAAAAEYSWQVAATGAEVEIGDTVDADNVAVAATRYFAPVDDQQGPTAVAAFLSRSSYIGIGGFDNDERQAIPFTSLSGTPQTLVQTNVLEGYTVTGKYVWRDSGWFAGGGFESAHGEQGRNSQSPNITDVGGYRLTAGKYLGDSTSLELTIGTSETDIDQSQSLVCSVFAACITGVTTTADDVALRAFHVGEIGRMSYSLSGGATLTEIDFDTRVAARPLTSPTPLPPIRPPGLGGAVLVVPAPTTLTQAPFEDFETYSLAAELFPTRRIGVRLGYTFWHDDPQRDDGYDVTATWFFVPRVAARVSFARAVRATFFSAYRYTDTTALEIFGRF